MVASIINAVIAEHGRERTEEAPRLVYFRVPCFGPDDPLEQTRKRLEALDCFPWVPPAGNA